MRNHILTSIGIGVFAGVVGCVLALLLGMQSAMLPIVVGIASGVSAAMMHRKLRSS